jgi:hypothetical protein
MIAKSLVRQFSRTLLRTGEHSQQIEIHWTEPPSPRGRCWVTGGIQDYRFAALVFPEHALNPRFELGRSRISKLEIRRPDDDALIVNFDRGWDLRPATKTAETLVNAIASQLADMTFPRSRIRATNWSSRLLKSLDWMVSITSKG